MGVVFNMPTFAAAGAAFLLAVLWFDLMFDVQSRGHMGDPLPSEVLASISAYYRRVTLAPLAPHQSCHAREWPLSSL